MRRTIASGTCVLLGVLVARVLLAREASTYVSPAMHWLLGIAAAVMVLMGVTSCLARPSADGEHQEHQHSHRSALWLVLLVPVLLLAVVAPHPLGTYGSQRPQASAPASVASTSAGVAAKGFPALSGDPAELSVEQYWNRATVGNGASLQGHRVVLLGFVSDSPAPAGAWILARMKIWCCAADALPFEVTVDNGPRPGNNTWVRVTGTYDPTDVATRTAHLHAESVEPVGQPDDPYLR